MSVCDAILLSQHKLPGASSSEKYLDRERAAALALHLREGREYLPFICGLKGAHP